jgi:hypothetical protein
MTVAGQPGKNEGDDAGLAGRHLPRSPSSPHLDALPQEIRDKAARAFFDYWATKFPSTQRNTWDEAPVVARANNFEAIDVVLAAVAPDILRWAAGMVGDYGSHDVAPQRLYNLAASLDAAPATPAHPANNGETP